MKPGECQIVTVERQLTAVVKALVPMSEIPQAQRSARASIAAALPTLDAGPVGHGCTLWRPSTEGRLDMEPRVIVARRFEPQGDVVPSALPGGRAAQVRLVGPFDGLPRAWPALFAWCAQAGLTLAGVNWEIYGDRADDPATQEIWLHALLA